MPFANAIAAAKRFLIAGPQISSTKRQTDALLNLKAARKATRTWEPSFKLPFFSFSKTLPNENEKASQNDAHPPKDAGIISMMTFSAFDPGAARPLRMSAFLFPITMPRPWWSTSPRFVPELKAKAELSSPPPSPEQLLPVTEQKNVTALTVPARPWPYSLPKRLQPKKGTTYQAIYSTGCADGDVTAAVVVAVVGASAECNQQEKPASLLQAVLYGVPDPDGYSYIGEAVRAKWMRGLVYGVKEEEKECKECKEGEGRKRE